MTEIKRLDRYFSGEMDDLERQAFDKEIMNNKKLAQAVNEYKSILTGIKSYGLQQKLNSIMADDDTRALSQPTSNSSKQYWLYAILGVAIVLAALWFFNSSNNNIPQEQLYMAYYYPEPGLPTTMGNDSDRSFNQAMSAYKRGEYQNALQQFEGLYSDSPSNASLVFYMAMCHQATGDLKTTQKLLKSITQNDTYHNRALWYLALIELKQGHDDRCSELLQSLSIDSTPLYKERAEKLLNQLRKQRK